MEHGTFARYDSHVAQYRNLNSKMGAGRFINSIQQKAGTARRCTIFPSTDGVEEPSSEGAKGLPSDLTTESCPQHTIPTATHCCC